MANDILLQRLREIQRPNIQRPEFLRPNIQGPEYLRTANNAPQKQATKAWGFEEDKANYGDIAAEDGDSLAWRPITAHNDDDGTELTFSVGYDQNGRISGVRQTIDGTVKGYYGKDMLKNFFQSNFDRDATNYSLYDADNDGSKWIIFNSKNDGAFVPSDALNMNRKSQPLPNPKIDTPYSVDEFVRNIRGQQGARNSSLGVDIDEEKAQAADNSTMHAFEMRHIPRTKQELEFFENNANDFIGMALEFSRTPDARMRMQILQKAYERYGSLPRFESYIRQMTADEESYANGYYPNYDYTKVGSMIADAINGVYSYMYHHV